MASCSVLPAGDRSLALYQTEENMNSNQERETQSAPETTDTTSENQNAENAEENVTAAAAEQEQDFDEEEMNNTGTSRFRRRRLSLPRYNQPTEDAEEAAVAAVSKATNDCCDFTHEEAGSSEEGGNGHNGDNTTADKSRKRRRLTRTSDVADASCPPASTTQSPSPARRRKKRRVRSMKHMHMMQGFLCRIRNRLLRTHPSNGTNTRNNSRAARPRLGSRSNSVTSILQEDDDDGVNDVFDRNHSPFSRDVVGTCSCHGIEPVYTEEPVQGDGESDEDYTVKDKQGEESDDSSASSSAVCSASSSSSREEPKTHDDKEDATVTSTNNGEETATTTSEERLSVVAKINQDRGGVAYPYANDLQTALFAAYDGHGEGGEHVAHFVMTEIQRRLEKHVDFDSNIKKAFAQTFVGVDEALADQTEIEPLYSGTTACVVLLRNRTLHIANVGDSRAVLARKKHNDDSSEMEAIDLSIDQNPDSPGEQERIERCGGFVSPPPEEGLSARVWLDPDYTHIGLAMSRSIGDHAVKSVGVISEPVVTTHTVTDDDEFIIIATDGVWEFIESEEAVDIVAKHLEANKGANAACQALIEMAALRWQEHEGDYRDDITAVVVKPRELWGNNERQ